MVDQAHRRHTEQRRAPGRTVAKPTALLAAGAATLRSIAAALAIIAVPAGSALAQARDAGRDTAEYVVGKVNFDGNALLTDRQLRHFIQTEATRCKSWVIILACRLSQSSFFETSQQIDLIEVGRDVLRIRLQYWLRGYRSAVVDTVIERRNSGIANLTFRIQEGEPLLMTTFQVNSPEGLLRPSRVRSLVRLSAGDPFDLVALDSARTRLRDALWDQGYSDALVQMDSASAGDGINVSLNVDPRWISRVGRIQITGNEKVGSQTIRNSMFVKVGDIYRRSELVRSQRALYESGLFSRATIDAVGATRADDSSKLVVVDVSEAKLRAARLGGGVSTVDFIQVDGQFTNFNWRGGARRVTLGFTVGNLLAPQLNGRSIFRDALEGIDAEGSTFLSPTWRASAELRIPWFRSPRNAVTLSSFAQRRSLPGIFVERSAGANAVYTRELADRITWSAGYQYEITSVKAGDLYFCVNFALCDPPTVAALRSSQAMSPLTLSTSINKANDQLSPTRGFTVRGSYEHASTFTLSDYRYNRVAMDAAAYLPAMNNSVLAFHLRGGWVTALGSTEDALGVDAEGRSILHPRKRFFAGGSHSVRGFGESQMGPRILTIPRNTLIEAGCSIEPELAVCDQGVLNDTGSLPDSEFTARPLGGNVLVEGSVELRVPIFRNFAGAVFVDAGLLGESGLSDLSQSTVAVTPGFGIRYASLAGPIRIDLGYNPFLAEDLPVVTEVEENGTNRITRLQMVRLSDGGLEPARRTFRPPRSAGFFGFLTRFSLHLSIGEAF